MKVTYLGHAGLKVETGHARVHCDPWFSPEGVYQASWFQYPDNHHLVEPELFTPSAVVISHEHLDHVDPWYLAHVPSHVPVVIPRYPSPVLRQKIQSARPREIIEVPPWEPVELADGVSVFFVSEESPRNQDSAIIIVAGGLTILNMNDACLSPTQLSGIRAKVGGVIDLFAFQASGASWHPMCYDYPTERKREISGKKRLAKFSYVARAIRDQVKKLLSTSKKPTPMSQLTLSSVEGKLESPR